MTAAFLAPNAQFRSWDNSGAPLVGGQLFTYAAGTTTPIATYTDSTAGTPNTNPIILNSRGEAQVWLLPNVGYKFILQDSSGNPIWTVDQIFNSQLLTLFGGVDTGSNNAYILNFNTPFTSYTNGEVIYFIPSTTNTAIPQPVTLNVNGLGPIPIVNINGSALGAGQIQAGQTTQVMYYNGSFQLISIGSFSGVTIGTFGQESSIASAATTDLGTALQHVVLITGTNTITSFGTSANIAAPIFHVRFSASLLLTNSNSLILPGAANIQTQAGDALLAQYLGSGTWKVNFYQTAIGGGSTNPSKIKPADTTLSTATLTADPDLITPVLAIGRYIFNIYLVFDSSVAGSGFKWGNGGTVVDSRGVAPSLGFGLVNAAAYGPTNVNIYSSAAGHATVSTGPNSNAVSWTGSLLVGTAGTFGISWAQNTASGGNTILRAGSFLQLQLVSTGSVSNAITHTYTTAGSFTETIPTGYNNVTIEVWGASAGGATSGFSAQGGGGGGSGGYALSNYSVTGHGGQTMAFVVGALGAYNAAPGTAAGTSSATSGTFTITGMNCLGGIVGTQPASNFAGGPGGPGGTATGGNVSNTTGNTGGSGAGPFGGGGGLGVPGINGGGNSGGVGANATPSPPGTAGLPGVVVFRYTV
jgi:hypothetical protein